MNGGADDAAGTEFAAEDVLPAPVMEPAVPIPLDNLSPWHRPRKQYVRRRQWMLRASRLVQHLKDRPSAGVTRREIRYLTLPGIDYFDVRMLADVCRGEKVDLSTVGFLAAQESNAYMARARVREETLIRAGHITDRSFTLPYRLEEVASRRTQAYREVAKRAPYDIINVDACGSIALSDRTSNSVQIIDAIHRLVELQLARTTERWLLFVTTDVRRETVSGDLIQAFMEAIRENAVGSAEFTAMASDCLGAPTADIEAALLAANDSEIGFLRLCVLGLSKWLLHNAQAKGWEVKVHDSYCYSTTAVGDDRPSMPSLAFEFIPPPPGLEDRYGVVNVAPAPSASREDFSLRAVQKCLGMTNLDARIANDNELAKELRDATRGLLEEAGYSPEALRQLDTL